MAMQRLDAFCGLANRACLHPCDWERFYGFVHFCHARRVELGAGRLNYELLERRMPDVVAKKLADYYAFGRCLLKRRNDWED
jgi:hypothetical protein